MKPNVSLIRRERSCFSLHRYLTLHISARTQSWHRLLCATASMIRLLIWLEDVWYLPTLLLLGSACCYNLWKAALISAGWLWSRQTNRSRLVALICDKLKLCERTFRLWFYFILYHSASIRVSFLALCSASLLLFSLFDFSCRFIVEEFNHVLLCPPWSCTRQHSTCSWPSCLQYWKMT